MSYLLIALVVLVVLLVLYLVARKVKPFGQSIAFVCTVFSRVNIKIAQDLAKAADYCNAVCLASLRYPPGSADRDYWHGIDVISHLVYFVLAVLILGGETVNTLLVLPALFQIANHVSLPGIVDIASAALFICCPALFGAVIFECWGKIPHGAGLFPRMGILSRWIIGIISGLFLLFTILVTGYFYLFRALYLTDPQSAQGMVVYILAGLGIEVAAVSPFALCALVVGGLGVVTLLMWVAQQVCRGIAGAALLVPSVLDTLAVHLSQGTMSVHGDYIGHDPYKVPALPFTPEQSVTALLPEHASMGNDEIIEAQLIETTVLEETKTMNPDKNAFVGFYGMLGAKIFPLVAQANTRLRATDSILTSYYLERANTHVHTSIAGIRDLSHTDAEKSVSMLHGETEDEGNHTLLCDLGHKLASAHHHLTAVPAPFVHFIDRYELVNAVDLLESIKRRQPLASQVVITSLSEQDSHNKGVQAGIADMVALHAEGFIDNVLVVAPDAPFARTYGEDTQLRSLAQLVISLIIAKKHHPQNPSFSSVFRQLHSLSPFIAVSFASQVVAVGEMAKRWSFLPGVSGHAGTGIYRDILTEVREATDRVITEEDTRTFPAQVRTDAFCAIVVNVPIELHDSRFNACVRDTALHVGTHYPFAQVATVRGNGVPYPLNMGRYLTTAACLYPLQPVSFPVLHGSTPVKVTPLYPVSTALEPVNNNGHVPTSEQSNTTKAKKAVSVSRQKKVTALKRGVRKNEKAAN